MTQKLLLLLLLCIAIFATAQAQTHRVTGRVTGASGAPLAGVTVYLSGTNTGTQTNSIGNYTITVPANASLVFSSVGYTSRTIEIGDRSEVNVQLESGQQNISEVIVNTGYTKQTRREVAGAISQIRGDQFENQAIVNFQQAVQGRMAGVNVTASNGLPGGGMNFRIRGAASFAAGTQPLYIVDGVQMSGTTFGGFTQTNSLAGINPNDIETIEVIKDAATASIYGAQAANGVVIITTKKGKAGKTMVDFNAYYGANSLLRSYNTLTTQDYFNLRTEAFRGANPRATDLAIRNAVLNEMRLSTTITDAEIAALPTIDWQNAAFRNGLVRNYEVSVSGGSEKTRFYLSGSHGAQEAVITNADFNRNAANLKVDHEVDSKLSLNVNVNVVGMRQNTPFAIDGSFLGNPAFSAPLMIPSAPIYNPDGSYFGLPGSGTTVPGSLNQNIIANTDYNSGNVNTDQLIGSASATYKFLPELSFRAFASIEQLNLNGKSYRDPRTPDGLTNNGLGQNLTSSQYNVLTTHTLNYSNTFNEDHKIDALLGFEYRDQNLSATSMSGRGFPSYLFRNLSAAAEPFSVNETWTGFKSARYLTKITYGYQGKYIVTANLNYSGSSRFGVDNLWGWFPGVSAAWNIDRESFLEEASWIDILKFRAGYGQAGNDNGIGNFASRALYSQNGLYLGQPGIALTNLPNPTLRWEKKTELSLGVDYGFFGSRVFGAIDVFQSKQRDMLILQPLITTSGFTGFTNNLAQIDNTGFEFDLNTVNVQSDGGLRWSTNFNFSYVRNSIVALYDGLQQLPTNVNLRVGESMFSVFTWQYAGVNPATGRPMWYDQNNNLTYQPVADDRRKIGQTIPLYTGGLANDFSYKGVDISILLQYQYGGLLNDGQSVFMSELGNRAFNTTYELYDNRWTTPGQLTGVARPYNGGTEPQGASRLAGSAQFWSSDMIRLKNVQLGYTLPAEFLQRAKIAKIRLYFQGNNLYTWTNFPGYDPEYTDTALGIAPQFRNYTFGFQLGF